MRWWSTSLLILSSCLVMKAQAERRELGREIKVTFAVKNFPSPMAVYEVAKNSRYDIYETKVVKKVADVPKSGPAKTTFRVESKARGRTMVLVTENKSDKTLYFFASPHLIHPAKASTGLKFLCLCNHQLYEVPPKSVWYRIVRVELDPSYKSKTSELNHTIVGINEKDALTTYKDQLYKASK